MTQNIITSEDVAPKKTTKAKPKKTEPAVVPAGEKIVVYFESGYSYCMPDGFTFTRENTMRELPADEAKKLLNLDNFRLSNDEEKQMYYNGLEA